MSPSGIAYRNQSRDQQRQYSSPCGGDVCNYDETIAKRLLNHQTSPQPTHTDQLPTQQMNLLTTPPPRGKLPTSSTLLSNSPAPPPAFGRTQLSYNSPNGTGGRYQVSPMDHHSRRYQSGLSLSPNFLSSPLSNDHHGSNPFELILP
jgi:hypothetical protein